MKKITISRARMTFAPIPYQSFEVGPLSVEIELAEGATDEDINVAMTNAHSFLDGLAESTFEQSMTTFFDRCKCIDEYMGERGMQVRSQTVPSAGQPAAQQSRQPEALMTKAQYSHLERLCGERGLDPLATLKEFSGKDPAEVTKPEASKILDQVAEKPILNVEPPPVDRPEQVVTNAAPKEKLPEAAPGGTQPFTGDPVAKTLADMVTTKQLGMIRAVAREAQVDADKECMEILNCRVSELSRKAASALIDHLREMKPQEALPPAKSVPTDDAF